MNFRPRMARATRYAAKIFVPQLQASWGVLTSLFLAHASVSQLTDYFAAKFLEEGRENISQVILIGSLDLVFGLVFYSLLFVALVSARRHGLTLGTAIGRLAQHLMIEQIRVLASVIWRVPLLIVPALLQYVRMTFVPYIVAINPNYGSGNIDALSHSRMLAQNNFFSMAFVLLSQWLITQTPRWAIETSSIELQLFFNPLLTTLVLAYEFLIGCFCLLFIESIYNDLEFRRTEGTRRAEQSGQQTKEIEC